MHEPVIPSCAKWVIGIVGLYAVGNTLDEHWVFRPDIFAQLTGLDWGQTISATAIAASLTHAGGIFKGGPDAADHYLFLNKVENADGIHTGREVAKIIKETTPARKKRILIGSILKNPPVIEYYDIP